MSDFALMSTAEKLYSFSDKVKDISLQNIEVPQTVYAGAYTFLVFALLIVVYFFMRAYASPFDGVSPVF